MMLKNQGRSRRGARAVEFTLLILASGCVASNSATTPRPPRSRDAEFPALAVTGRRELLRREKLRQIRRLQERSNFDLARARREIRVPPRPGQRLVHVAYLPNRKAG